MPRKKGIPAYQHHRGTGQARVKVDGHDVYLGAFRTEESKSKYDAIIRQLLMRREATATKERALATACITVSELAAAYAKYARGYYVKGGRQTSEYGNVWAAVETVVQGFGHELVTNFGPKHLR